MKNFFQVSRKLEISSKPHFKNIFKYWEKLSHVKNYCKINMFNIEELLSLIEMEEFLGKTNLSSDIREYISDVVNHFIIFPNSQSKALVDETLNSDWYEHLFVGSPLFDYGYFFLGLTNISIQPYLNHELWLFKIDANKDVNTEYSIISLNYDLVFEKMEKILLKKLGQAQNTKIINNESSQGYIKFIKLHGSSDKPESIIAPTWNKINSFKRKAEWEKAYSLLTNADEIRILGYSMPRSDTYFKYFLMSCLKDSKKIEKILVICLDDREKHTYNNYKEFFDDDLNMLLFYEDNIKNYLKIISNNIKKSIGNNINNRVDISGIEKSHNLYLNSLRNITQC